ncbi:MAG: HPr family phosphocarrier protein [Rhodospirillaceae bacterium]|nr:MAG: HPr family phosphocarrier protein [Rhodospirillaceae bacterium]
MTDVLHGEAEIRNAKGLHARAAAKFCKTVERFDAEVRVSRNGTEVAGTSIMGLMMLAAGRGSTIEISASGADAAAVFEALMLLITNKFDED